MIIFDDKSSSMTIDNRIKIENFWNEWKEKSMAKNDIVVIDTETTGLNSKWHEIIDIYAIRVDSTLEIIDEGGGLVIPLHLDRANPEALEVNGFDPARWAKKAKEWPDVLDYITPLLKSAIPCGHIVHFDLGMIAGMCNSYEIKRPSFAGVRAIDTCQLANNLKRSGGIKNRKLATVAAYFGIENQAPHTAKGDTHTTLEVLRRLRKRPTSLDFSAKKGKK